MDRLFEAINLKVNGIAEISYLKVLTLRENCFYVECTCIVETEIQNVIFSYSINENGDIEWLYLQ